MENMSINLPVITAQVMGKKFSIRAASYILDVIFIYILTFIETFFWGAIISIFFILFQNEIPALSPSPTLLPYVFGLLSFVIYFVIFEWLFGASFGKLILRMRVVMKDGSSCTLKAGLIRGLLRLIDALFFAIPAYATMKAPYYQRIGDNSANTIVLDSREPTIKQQRPWWWFLIALGIYIVYDSATTIILLLIRYL
jgi:uncharacterized RDD family membrane protein YckC